ncbi:hypothetical protein LF817_14485 [Halobacillus sp. A1]|uniref:tetratricopeptide repeat protein n=1 Tax=Halobacillus sp. A1 TaxID=2880262 RepID=UPI0020A62B57|nr:hypothetical protein [Halobacillus sp. A1]MCP3032532.1 hypothetical protein [Halobacillus sp. A1]
MNEKEQQVIDLFKSRQTDYDEELSNIVRIWKEFCDIRSPMIEKPNPYAAALEYLANRTFGGPRTTQKALAEKYETNPSQLSSKHRVIEQVTSELLNSYLHARYEELLKENKELWEKRKSFFFEDLKEELLQADTYSGDFSETLTHKKRSEIDDLIFSAIETPVHERTELLYKIYKIHPYYPDLYIMAANQERLLKDRKTLYFKAMIHASNELGPDYFKENTENVWLDERARSYMRAKLSLGNVLEKLGDKESAILHYRELLAMNEMDNQGIRYTVIPLYLKMGLLTEAETVLDQYDEATAFMLFNRALLHYLKNGLTQKTKQLLKEADQSNEFVKELLLNPQKIPHQSPDYYGLGDKNEAVIYLENTLNLWRRHPELIEALYEIG